MVGFAFSCLDLDAETLQTVVARMIGIVHDRTAKVTSQLAAVRVMIGLERQVFYRVKEELLLRRQHDPEAELPRCETVFSVSIVKQLITFLTSLNRQPEISHTHAVQAGNLLISLQRLGSAERTWIRRSTRTKPVRKGQSGDHPTSSVAEYRPNQAPPEPLPDRWAPERPANKRSPVPGSFDVGAEKSTPMPTSDSELPIAEPVPRKLPSGELSDRITDAGPDAPATELDHALDEFEFPPYHPPTLEDPVLFDFGSEQWSQPSYPDRADASIRDPSSRGMDELAT